MKKEITGGALFRQMKMYKRFQFVAFALLAAIGFLIFGSLTGDIVSGLAMASMIPFGLNAESLNYGELRKAGSRGKGDDDVEAPELIIKKLNEGFEKYKSEIKKLMDEKAGTDAITAIEKKMTELTEEKSKALEEIALKQGKDIKALQELIKNFEAKDKEKALTLIDEVRNNLENFKNLRDGGQYEVQVDDGKGGKKSKYSNEIILKTLVQRSAVTNNQHAQDVPGIGQLATRKMTLYDLFPKIGMGENHNGVIRYYDWDSASITRGAASVAEGAAFPESVAKWVKRSLAIEKIGDSIPVTDEFYEDEILFANELQFFLNTNVALEIDRQLYLGDGTSNALTGLRTSVPTFTSSSAGVQAPNINDLVMKMKESISGTGGGKYTVDFCVMNIADINKWKLTKDRNDNYIIYPGGSRDGSMIDGITVYECNIVTANELVLGDSRYVKIYEKSGIEITKGMVGNQFIEDESTLKARARLNLLIRTVDSTGFLKSVDIAGDVAALA